MFDFHQKIWHLYYQKKMLVVIKYWNVFSGLVERKICSNTSPCKANEGKCFLDSHCKDGLSCIKNKCNSLFIDTANEHTGNISRGFLLVVLVVTDSFTAKLYIIQIFSVYLFKILCVVTCNIFRVVSNFFWEKSKVFVFYLNLISSQPKPLTKYKKFWILTAIFSKWNWQLKIFALFFRKRCNLQSWQM